MVSMGSMSDSGCVLWSVSPGVGGRDGVEGGGPACAGPSEPNLGDVVSWCSSGLPRGVPRHAFFNWAGAVPQRRVELVTFRRYILELSS